MKSSFFLNIIYHSFFKFLTYLFNEEIEFSIFKITSFFVDKKINFYPFSI